MSSDETKSNTKLWIAVLGLFAFLCFQTYTGLQSVDVSNIDTVITLGKPVVNNYSFTNPTVYKERTVVYDSTRPSYVLTRKDSDMIVIDYLKSRFYSDSVITDTNKIFYQATVEKNSLKNIDIQTSYRPKILNITETKYRNQLFLGLAPAIINNNSLSIGANINYQWNRNQVGTIIDPIKKNYYFYMCKSINFNDKRGKRKGG